MQRYPFVVDETPYCLWDWEIRETNLRFLESVDPTYLSNAAQMLLQSLETDERHHAALAIRLTYFQALESFFAFLCAFVQAPHAPAAWVAKYKVAELRSVVSKLLQGRPVRSRLKVTPSWDNLADAVLALNFDDAERLRLVKRAFAKCWSRCARDLTDSRSTDEHNSTKHGIRTRSGGFSVAMGPEHTPGEAAPPEAMRVVGQSEFGSMYLIAEPVIGVPRLNIRLRSTSLAWHPVALAGAIDLLSMSLTNVLSTLKRISGGSTDLRFCWPDDMEEFEAPWRPRAGITYLQMNSTITPADIEPMSAQDVLATYDAPSAENEQGA